MTAHTFGELPDERHNSFWHYHCKSCGASKLVPGPTSCIGPYTVRVDAEAFPTCEGARVEMARVAAFEAEQTRVRSEAAASRLVRLADFCAKYPETGFYWVRHRGEVTIAQMFDRGGSPGQRRWLTFDDDGEGEFVDFDGVEVVEGPIPRPADTAGR